MNQSLIRRFLWVEFHGTWNGIQSSFWGLVCLIKGVKPSPQSLRAKAMLKQMVKDGKVRTKMPFTRQNWRLTKDAWERYFK